MPLRKQLAERVARTPDQQHQLLKSIIDNLGDGVVVADRNGRFLLFNPVAERLIGVGLTEAPPEEWPDVYGTFRPDGKTKFETEELPLVRALAGKESRDVEMLVRNPRVPEGVLISLTGTPLKDADGQVQGGVIVFRDITARRREEEAKRLRDWAAYQESVREKERNRIAREIHDELGQALTVLKLEVSRVAGGSEDEARRLESVKQLIDSTVRSVRRIAADLHPSILEEGGLLDALRWQAQEFERRTGIRCRAVLPGGLAALDAARSTAVFRILQEALTNVTRHARATRVTVRVRSTETELCLDVRDNGRGVTPDEAMGARSFGLMGMRERARQFGGTVEVTGDSDRGTTVTLLMPL